MTTFKPGDRVYSVVDFDYATVIGRHPIEHDFYRIRLDNPDIDGHMVTVALAEDLQLVKEKQVG